MALCILEPGGRSDAILSFFKARGMDYELFTKVPDQDSRFWETGGDLVIIDAEIKGVDIIQFLSRCRSELGSTPVVAFHSGAHGTRDAALIRMGAFDALSRNLDQWNTEVYLDRAMRQAAMVKKLLSLSWTDHLTGLYNRRFLKEDLEREVRRAARSSKDLAVALFDLDGFRRFNETYGDLKGDDILARAAGIIQTSIRRGIDSAYRYGGDEFLLVLPETDLDQGMCSIERILEKLRWRIEEKLTFSVGLALQDRCTDASALTRCAEEAMNRARDAGGDRVERARCRSEDDKWLDGTRRI